MTPAKSPGKAPGKAPVEDRTQSAPDKAAAGTARAAAAPFGRVAIRILAAAVAGLVAAAAALGLAALMVVAVAVPFGIALGGAAALVGRDVLALMLTTMVASSVAAGVMFAVGHTLGPADPDAVSVDSADYAPVPSDLSFTTEKDDPAWASSALVAFPLGAMAGMTAILLVLRGPEEVSARSARPEPR